MIVAVPVTDGILEPHFGHCHSMALFESDPKAPEGYSLRVLEAPEHTPGRFPAWLKEQGVDVVITGGMGARAQELCERLSIKVMMGAPREPAESLYRAYMSGALERGENSCSHGGDHEASHHHCSH